MPIIRGGHGCDRITVAKTDYMVILGGGSYTDIYSDILFYNIEQKAWNPTSISLPRAMAAVQGVVVLQLDRQGCNAMVLFQYPQRRLYICEGNYSWKWMDTTGKNEEFLKYVPVGSHELLPCGME